MVNLDVAELRSKIDLENKYVDFGLLRTSLTVTTVAKDANVKLSEPTYEGESRGKCPKCGKQRSLAVNINTNRFNCFAKNCSFKGGGAIDFFARLHDLTAKEASHLLACAYGIQPYQSNEPMPTPSTVVSRTANDDGSGRGVTQEENKDDFVTRKEFADLDAKLNRMGNILFGHMLECDQAGSDALDYDPPLTKHHAIQ